MSTSKPGRPNASGTGASGSGNLLALDGPRVVDALPDGLVPAAFYANDLRVQLVTPWTFLPGTGDTHTVIFVWHDRSGVPVEVVPHLRLDGPLTIGDFPLSASIPQAFLQNSAIVDLSFRVYADYPADPSFDLSEAVTIRIDRDAPGAGTLLAPAIFPFDPITDGYLNVTPLVPMQIPGGYPGREIGDEILFYFSDTNTLPTGAPTFVSAALPSATGPIFVGVPNTVFRSFPGAPFISCFYRLRDRAGNLNPQFSAVAQAELQVDLPEPTYIWPSFPQSESNPIQNPNKWMACYCTPPIWTGVEIRIEPGTAPSPGPVIQHGDLITLRFQGYKGYPDVDPDPNIDETLTHVWDLPADATGYSFWILDVERLIRPLKDFAGGKASYMVHRGGNLIGRSLPRYVPFDRVFLSSWPVPIYCWINGNGPEPEAESVRKEPTSNPSGDHQMSSNPNVPEAPRANPAAVTIAEALDDASGTIPANLATVGVTAECTTGDISDYDDWFVIEIREGTQPWTHLAGPVQMSPTPIPIPAKFDIPIPAPAGGFRHGFYQLRSTQYRDFGGFPGGTGDISDPGAFTVDLVPPYADLSFRDQPSAPLFPANLPAGTVIDDAYLTMNGGVQFGIPDNTFVQPPGRWAAGDFITFYWSTVMFPRPQDVVSPPGGIPMLATGNTFFLPREMIDLSGSFHAFYTITDRAGNVSRPSFIENREVRLIADPDRGTPFVPLAPSPEGGSTDDLIDIADYLLNPEVEIRTYNNHAPLLDRLEVQWDTQPYGPQGQPFATFPQTFTNMQAAIRAAYPQTAIGPQSVSVRYRISRNGSLFLSFDKTFRLDLSVGGPVNPGDPGTPNINLNQAHVFGAGSSAPDVLLPAHAGQPVRVDIVLWTVAVAPHPGLSIIFLWEDERVGPFPITTQTGGDTFSFDIDWAVVARHGNGLKTIKYLVLDPATTNENESPATTVDVQDAVTVMLPPARYVDLVGTRWSCGSLKTRSSGNPPILYGEVFVPGDEQMAVGVPLTLTLSLTNTYAGRPPGPFPLTLTHPALTQNDIDNGLTFEVDYMPYLAQAPTGNCVATYSTVLKNGVTGHGIAANTRVGMSNPHTYCDGTTP